MAAFVEARESLLQVDLFAFVHGDDLGRCRHAPL
jgi:hypothetical protein